MSIASDSALPPIASTSASISSSGSVRRPQPITVAPRRASSSAVARPRPVPAPETTQTCPSSRPGAKIRELRSATARAGYRSTLPGDEGPRRHQAPRRTAPGRARRAPPSPSSRCYVGGCSARARCSRSRTHFVTARMLGIGTPRSQWWTVPIPAFLIHHPSAGPLLVDTGLHPSVASSPTENLGRIDRPFRPPDGRAGRGPAGAASRPRDRRHVDRPGRDDAPALRPQLGDVGVPRRHLRGQRGRVDRGDDRQAAPSARLPAGPLRLRLRLPHGQLRLRAGRLLRQLRPHVRPVRRRQRPPRLHPGTQRRPPVA